MLVGFIEELEWAEPAPLLHRVTIRHRSPEGRLFEVHVNVHDVELRGVPSHDRSALGRRRVHFQRGSLVARVANGILIVEPGRSPARAPEKGNGYG